VEEGLDAGDVCVNKFLKIMRKRIKTKFWFLEVGINNLCYDKKD